MKKKSNIVNNPMDYFNFVPFETYTEPVIMVAEDNSVDLNFIDLTESPIVIADSVDLIESPVNEEPITQTEEDVIYSHYVSHQNLGFIEYNETITETSIGTIVELETVNGTKDLTEKLNLMQVDNFNFNVLDLNESVTIQDSDNVTINIDTSKTDVFIYDLSRNNTINLNENNSTELYLIMDDTSNVVINNFNEDDSLNITNILFGEYNTNYNGIDTEIYQNNQLVATLSNVDATSKIFITDFL